jgi:hypothetical protein
MLIGVEWPLAGIRVCALRLSADPLRPGTFHERRRHKGKNEIHRGWGRSIPPCFERKRSIEHPRLFKLFECERIGDAHGVSARRIGAKA